MPRRVRPRQRFAERAKGSFDVVQARVVVKVKQPVYRCPRYPEPARELSDA